MPTNSDYLDDPTYEGKCENNGYVNTGVVCLNGGFCWNPPLGNRRLSSACLCCHGYSGKTCEIPPTAASIGKCQLDQSLRPSTYIKLSI